MGHLVSSIVVDALHGYGVDEQTAKFPKHT